jgi:hypothetical protein
MFLQKASNYRLSAEGKMKFRHILKVYRQNLSRISRNPVALIILIVFAFYRRCMHG